MSCHDQTRAVRAAIEADQQHGAVVPPLYLSSNFSFAGFNQKRQYDYTRSGNPTRDELAHALAHLEHGAAAVITSSGMSAVTLVTHLLDAGELLLAPHDCYGGCHRAFSALAQRQSLKVEFVDFTNPATIALIRKRKPRMVWLETPSNPLLRISDIESVAQVCRQLDALLVVDNTFLSPALQQPITLGANIVVHSTTKYLNGHSDVVGGAVVASSEELGERLAWWANCLGVTGSPFDAYLTLRGIRTLHARLAVHQSNANALVQLLLEHPAVRQVYYPGLITHPGHQIACKQQNNYGAMISFELIGGRAAASRFLDALRYFSLAESLGGVESLIAHPATMTHAAMTPEARHIAGISEDLLRISVGIEAIEDLTSDLVLALDCAIQIEGSIKKFKKNPLNTKTNRTAMN